MNPTQVLRALRSIKWRYIFHHSKDGRRHEAEAAVRAHYENLRLEKRGIEQAEIVSTFHGGDGHPKEHVTVEFKDSEGNQLPLTTFEVPTITNECGGVSYSQEAFVRYLWHGVLRQRHQEFHLANANNVTCHS